MAYYVYIIQSLKDKRYYIGSTSNVETRLIFHNKGLQRSTRNRVPFILIYSEAFAEKSAALKREKKIKSFKGGLAFKILIAEGSGPA